jgi:predicted peroxiredoxin
MANNENAKAKQSSSKREASEIIQMINEAVAIAVKRYKVENPEVDVEAILSEYKAALPALGLMPNSELEKFVAHAKEQGTKMAFDSMEMGILAAGRKDMRNGLAEILNSLDFIKPTCSECDADMDNRGRGKKKSSPAWGK